MDDLFEVSSYILNDWSEEQGGTDTKALTGPRAIDAAARPINPPFLACG